MNARNAALPLIQPLIPIARNTPQISSETAKPPSPIRIIARRPCRSERFAQNGAAITQSSADAENAAATLLSATRSEEHTPELQSLMRISYAVFCLKRKMYQPTTPIETTLPRTTCPPPDTKRYTN